MSKKVLTGVVAGVLMMGGVVGGFSLSANAAIKYSMIEEDFKDIPVLFSRIQPSQNSIVFDYNGVGDFKGQNAKIINVMWEDIRDAGRLAEFGELKDQQPEWAKQLVYFDLQSWSMIGMPSGYNWQFRQSEMKTNLLDNKMMKLYYSVGANVEGEMVYYSGVIDYSTCARADGTIEEGVECVAVRDKDGNISYQPYFSGIIADWAATESGKYNPEVVYEKEILEGKEAREAERLAQEEAERIAREEAERLAQEEAERAAREEVERLTREEEERKMQEMREEAERVAREEAEIVAREEAERIAREEAERIAREEAARVAQEEAERLIQEERERLMMEEAERLMREEEERLAQEEAERVAREEAERILLAKIEELVQSELVKLREEMAVEIEAAKTEMETQNSGGQGSATGPVVVMVAESDTTNKENKQSENGAGIERVVVTRTIDSTTNETKSDESATGQVASVLGVESSTQDNSTTNGEEQGKMDLPELGEENEDSDLGWLVICVSVVVAFGAGVGFYWLVAHKWGKKNRKE